MTYAPAEGWAPRLRVGPSVLDQAGRCMRSWGLRYLLGYDSDDPTWADLAEHEWDKDARLWRRKGFPDYPSRKRSCALGTEAHAIVECHYLGTDPGAARWASFPGQVAQAWLDVMPRPDECDEVYTEIGVALWPEGEGPPIEGTSDLLLKVKQDPYRGGLGWDYDKFNGWLVGDWKTTSNYRYAKNAATLFTDRQGVVYPLAAMRRLNLEAIPGRWAYSLTDPKARRQARATDFVQTRENAEELARGYFAEAAVLKGHFDAFMALSGDDRVAYVTALPENTEECPNFGGCPHAWDRGGACTARRSLGSRVQAACATVPAGVDSPIPLESLLRRSLKGENMASPWMQAKQRFQMQQQASTPPGQVMHLATGGIAPRLTPELAVDLANANVSALDPQPATPAPADISAEPEETTAVETPRPGPRPNISEAPRRRGRPPGAKNRAAEPATVSSEMPGLISKETAAALLNAPCPPGVSPALRMAEIGELMRSGAVDDTVDAAFALSATAEDDPRQYAFRAGDRASALTLADIAAVAKATGAEVTIFFKGGAL